MKQQLSVGAGGRLATILFAAGTCLCLVAQPALGALDYNASLGADFSATYAGGLPTANPFGPWELHGPNGLASDLTAVAGGIPASGQAGWCQGAAGVCNGDPTSSYFQPPWQPGVTIMSGVAGHGPQEAVWTAPAAVDSGGVAIVGSIEQMFEKARLMRLSVFKNNSATAAFTFDAMPPVVDGVVLQRVNFGPANIAVNPGDKLRFLMDGSGAGGNGVPTFVAWNVELREIPEPTCIVLLLLGAAGFIGFRRR